MSVAFASSPWCLILPQHEVGHGVLAEAGQFALLGDSANRLDTEQEREQEQEQQKEVKARRDQQIDVEKFVDREYSRYVLFSSCECTTVRVRMQVRMKVEPLVNPCEFEYLHSSANFDVRST